MIIIYFLAFIGALILLTGAILYFGRGSAATFFGGMLRFSTAVAIASAILGLILAAALIFIFGYQTLA